MKFLPFLFAAALSFATAAQAEDRPVLVELFTSQGCSSCPPADAFLHDLAKRDNVVALAMHIDYWDYIGWKDSFAQPEFTARQRAYARLGNRKMIYTPQMVINGRDHVVGSNPKDTEALIKAHFQLPVEVDLMAKREGDVLSVSGSAMSETAGTAGVYLIRYQPQSKVEILRGENAGRTISYANVVVEMNLLAKWDMSDPLNLNADIDGDLPAVIIVQDSTNGPVKAVQKVN